MTVCTRFAPSPTGHLHIGSARTALFSWLYARKNQGKFILRIEDTDQERSSEEFVDAILAGMAWLGLSHDLGPYYQTQRFEKYKEAIDQLLATGHAYRCYCSKERLDILRADQTAQKIKFRYDGHCRKLDSYPENIPHVIRFCNPELGDVVINDLVYGEIRINNKELDDLILARTDGTPTYNLTVVVDDWEMDITHVIRGDDHINNTPRQINILAALGGRIPSYAHIPMILGPDGKRLSKRHGATGVMEYREQGYLPQALLNYLVRLGWSHGDQEIFSMDEMIDLFNLESVNNSAAAINIEKLNWLNQHYMKTLPPQTVAEALRWHLEKDDSLDLSSGPPLEEVVVAQCERSKTLKEMAEKSLFFFKEIIIYEEKAAKNLTTDIIPALNIFMEGLLNLTLWKNTEIHELLNKTAEQFDMKLGKIAQPIRVALTGGTVSPPIDVTIEMIGKDRVLERLRKSIIYINNQ